MGNKASKVASAQRILANEAKNTPLVKHSRPKPQDMPHEDGQSKDTQFAQRLLRLGQVSSKPAAPQFKPASEDKFTLTLEARQRLEAANTADLEKEGARKLLHPTTITSVLKSLEEGDSQDRVAKAFNLDGDILSKFSAFSIPSREKRQHDIANELLNENPSVRKPVRRKRNDERNDK